MSSTFVISSEQAGQTMAAVLREARTLTWNAARALCTTGKVFVNGTAFTDPHQRVAANMAVEIRENAKAPYSPKQQVAHQAIVYEDSQVIVINKPAGMSSVPYEKDEPGTAMDLIRDAWRLQKRRATATPLFIVHRIDKETSGLLMFAKTKSAEKELQSLLRLHDVERSYLCIAHGAVREQRIESMLVDDRGDGLRGSSRFGKTQGRRAVTHVTPVQSLKGATLCRVTLETGKTHQIRIHLSEAGHPLVGEKVYIRDFVNQGYEPMAASRLMLHAETLGFQHPVSKEILRFSVPPPEDFQKKLQQLGGSLKK